MTRVAEALDRPDRPVTISDTVPKGGWLGLLPDLGRDPLGFLTSVAHQYGDLVPMRLGLTRTVLVNHPRLIEDALVTHNADFRKNLGARRLGSLLGNGLLLSEGEFWLRQRRLMQPAFHRQRLTRMAETMVSLTEEVLATWRTGQTRDAQSEMFEITLRIAARTLFGSELTDDLTRIRRASLTTTDHFRSRLFTLLILLPDSLPTPGNRRYQHAVRDLDQLVYRIIAERRARANADPADDLLSLLLAARDDDGRGMTDRQLRDEVMTLLLAGHDTTALALTWALVLLARHPEQTAEVTAEVDTVLSGRPPTGADLPRLPFLEAVILETLRLYPTAWVIGREAVRDTRLGDRPVPKNTTVLMSPWVLHRDGRWFDQPEVFAPGRWSDGLAARLPRLAYVPFGGGQRVCIGSGFAQMEAMLILATIVQRFRWRLARPAEPIEPRPVVTLRPRGAVPLVVEAR
jgi:cytochrome P450